MSIEDDELEDCPQCPGKKCVDVDYDPETDETTRFCYYCNYFQIDKGDTRE